MRQCLFCDNLANSREHIWPRWILERVKPTEPLIHSIADDPPFVTGKDAHNRTRCVCEQCNHGWMSRLEDQNIPLIGNMMQDVAISLDEQQQQAVAVWALKMAMLTEFVSKRHRAFFHTKSDREQLRRAMLPSRTEVWLARSSYGYGLGAWGTDAWSFDKRIHCYVNTVLVGHLATQAMTIHPSGEYGDKTIVINPKGGPKPWPELTVQIWPVVRVAQWPPMYGFRGQSLLTFVRRFSYGERLGFQN